MPVAPSVFLLNRSKLHFQGLSGIVPFIMPCSFYGFLQAVSRDAIGCSREIDLPTLRDFIEQRLVSKDAIQRYMCRLGSDFRCGGNQLENLNSVDDEVNFLSGRHASPFLCAVVNAMLIGWGPVAFGTAESRGAFEHKPCGWRGACILYPYAKAVRIVAAVREAFFGSSQIDNLTLGNGQIRPVLVSVGFAPGLENLLGTPRRERSGDHSEHGRNES